MKVITFRLDDEVAELLTKIAFMENRTVSNLVRTVVTQYVEKLEGVEPDRYGASSSIDLMRAEVLKRLRKELQEAAKKKSKGKGKG